MRFLDRLRRATGQPLPPAPLPPAQNAAPRPAFPWPDPAADDPLLAMALALAPGRRILLTGANPNRLARATLALRREGAAFTLVATAAPPPNADDILREEALRWGMPDCAAPLLATLRGPRGAAAPGPMAADALADWWIAASIPSGTLAHHAGAIDLLIDMAVMDTHDPLARLTALAGTGAGALLFPAEGDAARWLPHVGFTVAREQLRGDQRLVLGRRG